jgi:hypothetical protein
VRAKRVPCCLSLFMFCINIHIFIYNINVYLGSRERPARKAVNLTALCELIVSTLWNTYYLTTLQASTTCYGDNFTFYMSIMFLPRRKVTYGPLWSVTGAALLFLSKWCLYLAGNISMGPSVLLRGYLYFFMCRNLLSSRLLSKNVKVRIYKYTRL